jgi:tRNA threonylcarbamoyladenosine biosynthesis protein TsaB
MITLLLDSSGSNLSVGISHNNRIVDQTIYYAKQKQSEMLIPEIVQLLNKWKFTLHDVSSIVVGKGPGSYTGIRLSLTIAKILAFINRIPLFAVSSLEILKISNHPTICILNARSNRSYVGVYQANTNILTDTVMTNDELLHYIKKHSDYKISGDVKHLYLEAEPCSLMLNLLNSVTKDKLVTNIDGLRPVYLKEYL